MQNVVWIANTLRPSFRFLPTLIHVELKQALLSLNFARSTSSLCRSQSAEDLFSVFGKVSLLYGLGTPSMPAEPIESISWVVAKRESSRVSVQLARSIGANTE